MVIRNDLVTVKHTKLIFKEAGTVMMAFILATDFDFIAYMSNMAFFGSFWNMISMIFVVLYDSSSSVSSRKRTHCIFCVPDNEQ